jgi:hypothetical protein
MSDNGYSVYLIQTIESQSVTWAKRALPSNNLCGRSASLFDSADC